MSEILNEYLRLKRGFFSVSTDAAVSITSVIALILKTRFFFRFLMNAENCMVSVERVFEFSQLESENSGKSQELRQTWPESGKITFENVNIKYNPEDPPVVKNFTFTISGGQTVGIIGRTGAGKSSLTRALFQMVNYDGSIYIDGVNTTDISLDELRSAMSIIPQDPSLFNGTVRDNLDPFNIFSDDALWNVLKEMNLDTILSSHQSGLQALVTEGGGNFSTGEKQLLCAARAALKKNKIIILDEATANVDNKSDKLMQDFIIHHMKECTVIIIAHRLDTIKNADVVLVMEDGILKEHGPPLDILLRKRSSYFSDNF